MCVNKEVDSDELNKKICQKILLSKENNFTLNYINQSFKSRGCRSEIVMNIFNVLKKEGFGNYNKNKNARGAPSFVFSKGTIELKQRNIEFLEKMEINTEKVYKLNISLEG